VEVEDALHGLEGATAAICIETIEMEWIENKDCAQQLNKPYSNCRR
jgi:hypothetical protein